MFDIGFWEIIVIGVVALLVVGPEKFPGLIRNIGFWVGRFRRIASTVKSELQTEINKAEQLQKLLEEQEAIVKRHETIEFDSTKPSVSVKGRVPAPPADNIVQPQKPPETNVVDHSEPKPVERKPE